MLIDKSKEEIARNMMAQAVSVYGQERAQALRGEIEKQAEWIFLLCRDKLELDCDEPDFLVAPDHGREVRR